MSNNVKRNQHNFKLIRRFNEDILGVLAIKNKPTKVLNYIFEAYRKNYKYKQLLLNRSFFFSNKHKYKKIYKYIFNNKQKKFLYNVTLVEKEFRRKKRTIKSNNYLMLLKFKRFYGNLGKKKFKRIFKETVLTNNILGRSFAYFVESRLDVILYRANFFTSIYAARQYINHKKVYINGVIVNKPGFKVFINDIITVSTPNDFYITIKQRLENKQFLVNYPKYLEVNYKLGSVVLTKIPDSSEVPFPFFINLNKIRHNFLQ